MAKDVKILWLDEEEEGWERGLGSVKRCQDGLQAEAHKLSPHWAADKSYLYSQRSDLKKMKS